MNPIEFAKNLFLLRREHRMTIEDLAAAMEVTPELVCEWECAKKSPTLDQINRLAKIYGMPLSDVIQSPKIPKPSPVPEPEAEQTPEQPAQPEKEDQTPPPTEEYTPKRGKKKKKPAVWEILIIVLLLLIIGASLTFLIKPEWFPFLQYLGS